MTIISKDQLALGSRGVISLIGAGGKTSLMFCLARELAAAGKRVLTTTSVKIFKPEKEVSPVTITTRSFKDLVAQSTSCLTRYPHFSAGKELIPGTGKLLGFSPDMIDRLWAAALFDWIIVEADGARCKPLKASAPHEPLIPGTTTHLVLVTGLDAVKKPLCDRYVHRAALFSANTGLIPGDIIHEESVAAAIAIEIDKARHDCPSSKNHVVLNKADTIDRKLSGKKIAGLLKGNKTIEGVIITSLKKQIPLPPENGSTG